MKSQAARSFSPSGLAREAAVVVSVGISGLEPDGFTEVGDRPFEIAQIQLRDAAVVKGVGEFRLDARRVVKIGDRIPQPPQIEVGQTPVVVGQRDLGAQADRFGKAFQRLAVSFLVRVEHAHVQVDKG